MSYANEIFGGLLIGLGSILPLLYEGRIAGVSGYAAASLRPKNKEGKSGLLFVLGLILGSLLWRMLGGHLPNANQFQLPLVIWGIAGLLVGFGTRLGGGCTSGHGVCGLGRLSYRSLASVVIFMALAMLTTYLMRVIL